MNTKQKMLLVVMFAMGGASAFGGVMPQLPEPSFECKM